MKSSHIFTFIVLCSVYLGHASESKHDETQNKNDSKSPGAIEISIPSAADPCDRVEIDQNETKNYDNFARQSTDREKDDNYSGDLTPGLSCALRGALEFGG